MKVFLDVGAHCGQTLKAVLERDFGRIYCFEPASQWWPVLHGLADKRVVIEHFGLWDRDTTADLLNTGSKGASLWHKNNWAPGPFPTEVCKFQRASDWFRKYLFEGDEIYLKLNCEGAECDILDDLLDSGEFRKVSYALVCFDVHKIDSQRHREEETKARLAPWGEPRIFYASRRGKLDGDTHRDRIHSWLNLSRPAPRPR